MDASHKQLLKKHRVELVNNIKDVDSVLDHLVSAGVIEDEEEKEIKDREGVKAQVRKLLTILGDKEGSSFLPFCTALENSPHKRLATLLRGDGVKKGERVFIIHAGEDKAQFVEPLVQALQDEGLSQQDVFYDVLSIGVGDVIRARIMSAMASESLELVVTVLSQNSLNHKYWPKLELETALRHNKQLFPVWLDDNEDDFQEFNGLVGKYCPTLKSIRGYKVPRSSAREEVGKVAKEIMSKLKKRKSAVLHGTPEATTKEQITSRTRRKRMRRKTSSAASNASVSSEQSTEEDVELGKGAPSSNGKIKRKLTHRPADETLKKQRTDELPTEGDPEEQITCRKDIQTSECEENDSVAGASADEDNAYFTMLRMSRNVFHPGNVTDPDKFEQAVQLFQKHAELVIGTDASGSEPEAPQLERKVKLRLKTAAKQHVKEVNDIAFTDMVLRDLRTYNRMFKCFEKFEATLKTIKRGCVLCYLDFDDMSCYRTFLAAYRDGRLSNTLTRELITDDMRAAEGENLYIHVTLLEEDGGCQDDNLSDEDDPRGPTGRRQVESSTSGLPDIIIKQEPLSPVKLKVEPTDLPSCSYATEAEDTKPTSELKFQQPLGLKTELINRRPPFDFQKVRLSVKAEPHFHVKRERQQPGQVTLCQHSITGMGPRIKTEEVKAEQHSHHQIKIVDQWSIKPRHRYHSTEQYSPTGIKANTKELQRVKTEPHYKTEVEQSHLTTEPGYDMATEQYMGTEQYMDTEHHMDTGHHMGTEQHMGTEPPPYMVQQSTKETETVAGFEVQQEQMELMYQTQQQEEPYCYHCCNQLMLLAECLGPYWTWLALQLGFTSTDVERISSTYHPSDQPHWCLWEWVQRELWGATMDAVLVGLRAAGLHQIADAVETGELFQKDVDDGSFGSDGKDQGDKGEGSSSDGDTDDDDASGGASHKAKPRAASQISTIDRPTYPTGEDALAWNDCLQDFFKTDEDTARSIQERWPSNLLVKHLIRDRFFHSYLCQYWKQYQTFPDTLSGFVKFVTEVCAKQFCLESGISNEKFESVFNSHCLVVGKAAFKNQIKYRSVYVYKGQLAWGLFRQPGFGWLLPVDSSKEVKHQLILDLFDPSKAKDAFQFVHDSIRQFLMAEWVAHAVKTHKDYTELLRLCAGMSDHLPITCCSLAHLLSRTDSSPTRLQQFVHLLMQRQGGSDNFNRLLSIVTTITESKQLDALPSLTQNLFPDKTLDLSAFPEISLHGLHCLAQLIGDTALIQTIKLPENMSINDKLKHYPFGRKIFTSTNHTNRIRYLSYLPLFKCLSSAAPDNHDFMREICFVKTDSEITVETIQQYFQFGQPLMKVTVRLKTFTAGTLGNLSKSLLFTPNITNVVIKLDEVNNDDMKQSMAVLSCLHNLKHAELTEYCSVSCLTGRSATFTLKCRTRPDTWPGVFSFLPSDIQELVLKGRRRGDNYSTRWVVALPVAAVNKLASSFSNLKRLVKLDLKCLKASSSQWLTLFRGLSSLPATASFAEDEASRFTPLKMLGFAFCDLTSEDILSLMKTLPTLPNLEEIDLSSNDISDEAVPGLEQGLGSCQNLKKVNLSYNKLSDKGDFLPPLPNLEEIDLSHNIISDQAVPGLAKCFASCQNLTMVYLGYNKLSDVGELIGAFSNLPILTSVDIEENSISDESLPAIAAWLKVSTAVEDVWMNDNKFIAEGVRDFVRTMKGKAYELSGDLLYDGSLADVSESVEPDGEGARREEQQWEGLRREIDLIDVKVRQLTVWITHKVSRSNDKQLSSP